MQERHCETKNVRYCIAWSRAGCHIFCFRLGVYVYRALGREQVKESTTSCGDTDADEADTR